MPCSLSRWTGACGQSLGGASRLMSLVTGGLRAKLFGDDGKYSSMTAACNRSSPFAIASSVETGPDDVAQRLECAELAPAWGAPQNVGKRQQAGRTPYASRGRMSAAGSSRLRGNNRAQGLECTEPGPALGALETVRQRQQAGRTPYASRVRMSAAGASRPRGRNRAKRLECVGLAPALGAPQTVGKRQQAGRTPDRKSVV